MLSKIMICFQIWIELVLTSSNTFLWSYKVYNKLLYFWIWMSHLHIAGFHLYYFSCSCCWTTWWNIHDILITKIHKMFLCRCYSIQLEKVTNKAISGKLHGASNTFKTRGTHVLFLHFQAKIATYENLKLKNNCLLT